MDLTRVIIGPIVTEKAERLKAQRTYVLRVAPQATKIDIKAALKRYYDVEAQGVSVQRVVSKTRSFGRSGVMKKRAQYKKAMVTLAPKSKALDIASFKI